MFLFLSISRFFFLIMNNLFEVNCCFSDNCKVR